MIRAGELTIDPDTYAAKLKGRPLDLTYKEFELLKFLAQHPGRVFTRDQLLREVWGYDYFGGTRTVDVHVRRLRAKLGAEHESMIGTVRQVGYKFVVPPARRCPTREPVTRSDRQAELVPVTEASSGTVTTRSAAGRRSPRCSRWPARPATPTACYPLSEHVVLHLRHGGEHPAVHLLARDGRRHAASATRTSTRPTRSTGAAAELVVHPLHRRHGLGRALVTAAIAVAGERAGGRLRLWAHGDHPSAAALARRLGFDRHAGAVAAAPAR